MAEQAKIQTLHDHDTGEAIAPRTDVKAISGKGKKWNYVGFTDDNVVGLIEGTWPCNRNLLDNPDYTHPVNQRNANKYESNGYTIDRWILLSFGNPSRLEVQEGYITLSNAALRQNMDVIAGEYFGRTMTFSTLYADNTLHSITGEIPKNTGSSPNYYFNGAMDDGCNVQFGYYDALADLKFFALINTMGQEKSIKAVKLEVGSTQTLAHKEGDTWVLNEIPDYATELAKCQRYQLFASKGSSFVAKYNATLSSNKVNCYFHTPVPMAKNPTIIGKPYVNKLSDNTRIENAVVSGVFYKTDVGFLLDVDGVTEPVNIWFSNNDEGLAGFDANL